MLKPIFDEDVDFFSKKIILCAKGGDFKKGACHKIQILCLSTLNLINQRNVSHIKLSKYCDIDARLILNIIIVANVEEDKNLKKYNRLSLTDHA